MEIMCAKITATSMFSIISGMTRMRDIAFFTHLCLRTPLTEEDLYAILADDQTPRIVTRTDLDRDYDHPEIKKGMTWFTVEEK